MDDDDVSFLSVSDSDVESESVGSYLCNTEFHDIPRSDSPAVSVSSSRSLRRRSTPKRMAPQPPTFVPIPLCVAGLQKSLAASSSFRQEFQKGVGVGPIFVSPIPVKDMGTIASHPIQILPPTVPSDLEVKQATLTMEEPPSLMKSPARDFSRLQIRLIDDEPEIIDNASSSPSVLVSQPTLVYAASDMSGPSRQITSLCSANSQSSPLYYTSSVNLSQVPNVALANPPMGILASSSDRPHEIFPNLPHTNFSTSSQVFLPNSQRAFLPTGQIIDLSTFGMPQSPKAVITTTNSNYAIQNNYSLSHSASEPGLVRVIGRSSEPFPLRERRLESLSEEEEDSVFFDENYAAVEYRNDRKSRSRVSRSNSNVTVAHLYEDLLVSSRFNLKVTLTNLTVVVVIAALFVPNSSAMIFNAFRLIFGTLFPAYYSYKAVRTKNVKEYVKWMMYWIVFAFFTCIETITDVFLSFWFPFYYEIKILVVLWLLSPATRGSSILYRKFVHPWLTRREEEIDDCIAKAKQQGYTTVVQLGTKGVNYATSVIMQTAIKGGGGLVNQLKRSYSTSEIGEDVGDMNRNVKALAPKEHQHPPAGPSDDEERSISSGSHESETRTRSESESSSQRIRGHSTGRAVRSAKTRSADVSDVHFLDVSDGTPQRRSPRTHDVMSASAGVGGVAQTVTRRSRTGDVSSYATLPRTTSKRVGTSKKKQI